MQCFLPFKHMVWFLVRKEIKVLTFSRNQLRLGIGSCSGPNDGLARHPFEGKYVCKSLSDVSIFGCAMLARTREHLGGVTMFVLPASKQSHFFHWGGGEERSDQKTLTARNTITPLRACPISSAEHVLAKCSFILNSRGLCLVSKAFHVYGPWSF